MTSTPRKGSPPYAPEDLTRFIDVTGAALAPGSDEIVYVANTRDGVTACTESQLWRWDGTDSRIFSDAAGAQSRPAISADGSALAYLQVVDGRRQLCVAQLADAMPTVLTSWPRGTGPAGPQWSPDGRLIAIDACDEPPRDPSRPYRVTRPIWRRDGLGLIEDIRTDVFIVPVTGGPPRRLTFDDGVVCCIAWSGDGQQILYGTWGLPDSSDYAIKLVDVRSGSTRTLTSGRCLAYAPVAAWLPDGRVVYTSPWHINERVELMVLHPESGASQSRTPGLPGQLFGTLQPGFSFDTIVPSIVVAPDGSHCYVFVQDGGSLVTYRVAMTGEIKVEAITAAGQSAAPIEASETALLTVQTSFLSPPNLHRVHLPTGSSTRVTRLNDDWLTEAAFDVRRFGFAAEDGTTEVEAWFLKPRAGRAPYPTVLSIHGGPFGAHGETFSVDDLLLASAGYGVLHVNYRGGSGYGDDFALGRVADIAQAAPADLLAGVQVAVERGWADDRRLAAFGLSFGGYLTTWLLGHSDRFRAGVAECPVTDWTGMLGSDISEIVTIWADSMPGNGEASMAPYVRSAPVTYAARCSAPLLIIEHEADLRCPVSQGDVLYNELKLASKTVEMLRLPQVPHVPYSADLPTRVARAEALLDWLARHVR